MMAKRLRYTAAKRTALETAKLNRLPRRLVRLVSDTDHNGDPCYTVTQTDGGAVVVYADEPNCVVSTGNHRGRYVPISEPKQVRI